MRLRTLSLSFWLLLCSLGTSAPVIAADTMEWPQVVAAEEGNIIIYQPQPESLDGNRLVGRSAMSLEIHNQPEPVFGVFWFEANIETDQDTGVALINDIKVTRVRWPDSKDTGEQRFTRIVEDAIPSAGYTVSLERLSASLAAADLQIKSLTELNNDPPKIIFSEQMTVLLMYDGQPQFTTIDDSSYERAVNSPFLVVRDKRNATVYLSSGESWYTASDPLGPWELTPTVPQNLVNALPTSAEGNTLSNQSTGGVTPEIIVATLPTELVVSGGKPVWDSLPGGEILYVKNTETPWLRDLTSGEMYVLLSGRWYRALKPSGPWTFVPADELPQGFSNIPPASDIGGIRTSVAGTQEAEEALLDAQIPQTAAIKRREATLAVEYSGAPEFKHIPSTKVSYALNTATQVLLIEGIYYAVDNGVWFVALSAQGPWVVADKIPSDEIAKIPPSEPVYNTTYVHVYHSTPEVVYVGYTPGYLWAFSSYGVPVYGTGWYYPPYVGPVYYPRPPTWGLHVGYNPWTGWNYGVTWSNGFLSVGAIWSPHHNHGPSYGCCGGGWYGGGYRSPVVINRGDINIGQVNIGDINIGNNINAGNREIALNKISNRSQINRGRLANSNIYNRADTRTRNTGSNTRRQAVQQPRVADGRRNNVYADSEGNVSRRTQTGWEKREQQSWKPDSSIIRTPARTRLNNNSGRTRASRSAQLEQARQARSSGGARERANRAMRQRR